VIEFSISSKKLGKLVKYSAYNNRIFATQHTTLAVILPLGCLAGQYLQNLQGAKRTVDLIERNPDRAEKEYNGHSNLCLLCSPD